MHALPSRFLRELPAEHVNELRPAAKRGFDSSAWGGLGSGMGGYNHNGYYGNGMPKRADFEAPTAQDKQALQSVAQRMQEKAGSTTYKLGGRVTHGTFGEGTILAMEGDGARQRLQIRFRGAAGTKWLIASVANLVVM